MLYFFDKGKKLGSFENLSLSYLIGQGALTLILFWSFFFPFKFRVPSISIVIFILFVAFNRFSFVPRIKTGLRSLQTKNLIVVMLLVLIVFKLVYAFVETGSKPGYSWDASGNWTINSKIYYYVEKNFNDQVSWAITNTNNYPKMISIMHYWLFSWMGEADDQWSNIFFPLSLLCFIYLFYLNLFRARRDVGALFFTYVLISTPFYLYHSTIGYAGLSMSIYLSLGAIYFYRWVREREENYFWMFSLFFAMTTWLKLEGKTFFVLGFILLIYFMWRENMPDKVKRIIKYASTYIVIGLPWQILTIVSQMPSREKLAFHLKYFVVMHHKVYYLLFLNGTWGIIWIGIIAAMLIFYKRLFDKNNIYLALSLVLFYGIVLFAYLMTYDAYFYLESAFNRTWIFIYPLAVFTVGCIVPSWKELTNGKK